MSGRTKAIGVICVLLAVALAIAYIFHGLFALFGVLIIVGAVALLAFKFLFIRLLVD